MMKCCPECFDDTFLRELALEADDDVGYCDCCGTDSVHLLDPDALVAYFEPLLQLYTEDASGEPLAQILRRDWGFFMRVKDEAATALLEQMFPELSVGKKRFTGLQEPSISVLADWDSFRSELKHTNRFFPSMQLNPDNDSALFWYLRARPEDVPDSFFRARVCDDGMPIDIEHMGAPPPEKARGGRANPRGIPYLYVASDVQTAIYELRPHPSEILCVARFEVVRDLSLADLRNPKRSISPFRIDEDELKRSYGHIAGLSRLDGELSRPVPPREADLEYLPSQYLSEFIKHCGLDGLIYTSAMGPGVNYALFAEEKIKPVSVSMYEVDQTEVAFHEVSHE